MTEIGEDEVRRIAGLARLELDDAEVGRLAADLERILGHFQALADVKPGEGGEPAGPELPSRLRSDVPGPDPMARPPGELAPDWRDGFYVVPRSASVADAGEAGP